MLIEEVLILPIKLAGLKKQCLVNFSPASAKRVEIVERMTIEHATAVFTDIANWTTFTSPLCAICPIMVIATTC